MTVYYIGYICARENYLIYHTCEGVQKTDKELESVQETIDETFQHFFKDGYHRTTVGSDFSDI
jgi:hypothetical protein